METVYRIKKDNPNYKGVAFAMKALSKDDTRYILSCLHVQDNIVYATDGHRVMWYELENLLIEDGNYEVLKSATKDHVLMKVEDEAVYPNIASIMPDLDDYSMSMMHLPEKSGVASAQAMWTLTKRNAMLNLDYLMDLVGHEWECHVKPLSDGESFTLSAIQFNDERYHAIIMPMRPADKSARIS